MKLMLILVLFITGCNTSTKKEVTVLYTIECVDGIEFLRIKGSFNGHLIPHFKRDGSGTLYTCK